MMQDGGWEGEREGMAGKQAGGGQEEEALSALCLVVVDVDLIGHAKPNPPIPPSILPPSFSIPTCLDADR